MRLLVLALLVSLSPVAWAEPGNPEEQALVRELSSTGEASPSLDALVKVFEADAATRPARVEALGALGDPRLVRALGYVVRQDREIAVRVAAARALGAFIEPRAEALALSVARDDRENLLVREAATRSLAKQQTESAGDSLVALALDADEEGDIRQAAIDELRAHYPALVERHQLKTKVAGSSGRAIATVVGAASGAYTLSLVGQLSPSGSTGAVVGAFGGLVIGGAAANLLALNDDLDEGDAQFIGSAGIWSVPTGFFAGRLLGGPSGDCPNGCTAVMLGTHLAAMGTSWALRDHVALSTVDTLEVNAIALSGLFLSLGLVDLPRPQGDVRPGYGVLAAVPTAAFVAGTLFADDLRLTSPVAAMTVIAALDGLYLGQMLGDALLPAAGGPLGGSIDHADKLRQTQIDGFRWIGLGLGMGGLLASSAWWQPSSSDVQLIGYATLLGHALGAGVPMLASDANEFGSGAMTSSALTGLASAVAVGLLTKPLKLELEGGDRALMPLAIAFSSWQGLGWSLLRASSRALQSQDVGLGLTIAALGGASGLVLSQYMDADAWETGWAFSGSVWGGWLAGWGAYAWHADGDTLLTMALVGSAVGLAAGTVLVSPLVGIDPSRLAWTSVFGVAGMTVASMAAVFVAYDPSGDSRAVSTANVVGSVVGLAVGAVVSGWLVDSGAGGDLPSLGLELELPSVAVSPVFEPGGTRMEGMSATFAWVL